MIARRQIGLSLLATPLLAPPVRAQAWAPAHALRWIVSYGAGGPADTFARLIARQMQGPLGHNVVVDNRPGGGGVLATEMVVRAPADGLTLLMVDNGIVVFSPALYSRLPYDLDRDLTGIGLIGRFPLMLVVRSASPITSFAEFLEAARRRAPTYGSGAVASPQHLATEVLRRAAGFEATHVPYRNSPAAVQDLLAGSVDFMLTDSASAMGAVRQGQARPLLVMSAERVSVVPDVPTTRELGLGDLTASAWLGMSVAAATPAPAIARLNTVLNEAIATPDVAAAMRNISAEPVPGDAAAFNALVRRESEQWRPLIRELGIRLD